MKKTYLMPTIELEEFVVEGGIALSYGATGYAGQDGSVFDYEGEEL